MRHLLTTQLTPGMVLGENIYSFHNTQLVMPRGTVLDDKLINKLVMQTKMQVMVEDEELAAPLVQKPVHNDNPSYAEKLRETKEFKRFKKDFEETFSIFERKINDVISDGAPIEPETLAEPVYDLIGSVATPSGVFDMLHSLRQYDDATYVHCVNVALISNAIGSWLRLPEEDLRVLTQAGLLHDIGKLLVPHNIISKPAKLTREEYTIIQEHSQKGFELVEQMDIDPRIKNAILMHHERCDGTGYPGRLKSREIDTFAKYVAIADVYDAITSARVYRDALCPFEAISLMESEGIQKFDPEAVLTFMSNVVNVYLLNRVRLNDGREGEIIFVNRDHFARPTLRVGDSYVDLSLNPMLYIEAVI